MIIFTAKMFVNCCFKQSAILVTGLLLISTTTWAQAELLAGSYTPQPSVTAESVKLETVIYQIENTLKFRAIVINPSRRDLLITIRNDQNKIVYQDEMKNTPKYIRKFDLSSLGDGQYSFEVSNEKETYQQSFTVTTVTARQIEIK
jgi:hypothetical protein